MPIEMDSKNPELETRKMKISEHGYLRLNERFNFATKAEALGSVRGWLRQAERIGRTTDEDGKDAILYGHGRIAMYVSLDLTTVITVIKQEHVSYVPIKAKVAKIHIKEFEKFDQMEFRKNKGLKMEKLKTNMYVSQLEYRKARTRSDNVKKNCDTEIGRLQKHIQSLEDELIEIKNQKRQVANSYVSVL